MDYSYYLEITVGKSENDSRKRKDKQWIETQGNGLVNKDCTQAPTRPWAKGPANLLFIALAPLLHAMMAVLPAICRTRAPFTCHDGRPARYLSHLLRFCIPRWPSRSLFVALTAILKVWSTLRPVRAPHWPVWNRQWASLSLALGQSDLCIGPCGIP